MALVKAVLLFLACKPILSNHDILQLGTPWLLKSELLLWEMQHWVYCCISVSFKSKHKQRWSLTIFNRDYTGIFLWRHWGISILFSFSDSLTSHVSLRRSHRKYFTCTELQVAKILSMFFWFCAFCFLFFCDVASDRLCNKPSKAGLFLSVKVIFLFGFMITYPFLSLLVDVRPGYCFSTLTNGRCGNQLPQPLSKMQCCCDSGRCWSSTAASAPEMCPIRSTGMNPPVFLWHWIRQSFSFISNVFITALYRIIEAGRHLGKSFSLIPLLEEESLMAGCSGPLNGLQQANTVKGLDLLLTDDL